jgi:hypothetical protein
VKATVAKSASDRRLARGAALFLLPPQRFTLALTLVLGDPRLELLGCVPGERVDRRVAQQRQRGRLLAAAE